MLGQVRSCTILSKVTPETPRWNLPLKPAAAAVATGRVMGAAAASVAVAVSSAGGGGDDDGSSGEGVGVVGVGGGVGGGLAALAAATVAAGWRRGSSARGRNPAAGVTRDQITKTSDVH